MKLNGFRYQRDDDISDLSVKCPICGKRLNSLIEPSPSGDDRLAYWYCEPCRTKFCNDMERLNEIEWMSHMTGFLDEAICTLEQCIIMFLLFVFLLSNLGSISFDDVNTYGFLIVVAYTFLAMLVLRVGVKRQRKRYINQRQLLLDKIIIQ